MGHGLHYPKTPAGLVACYVAALPFSLNMLYGNLLFTGLLFGGMEWYKAHRPVVVAARGAIPA